jgi:hypothetical protein
LTEASKKLKTKRFVESLLEALERAEDYKIRKSSPDIPEEWRTTKTSEFNV